MPYDPARHRLVFVGGLHRSGTTLLGRLLAEHPLVTGFANTGVPADEGQHLQSVYPTARTYGGPGRFAFAAAAHLTESSNLVSPANAERLLAEWTPHWDVERPVLLEKSPPNLIRGRFLQALFPGASFLVVVRHPVAVSFATQKWSNTSLSSLLRHWLAAHETWERDRAHLRHVRVLAYEDLIRRTDECLAGVYRFLGLEPAPRSIDVRADGNDAYFARWRAMRLRRAVLSSRFEGAVEGFGYSLRDLDRAP